MLSLLYGMLAMVPVTFGIAGYALVSRQRAARSVCAASEP